MNKLQFITRQLDRAQRKRFEHYVIQRIWHKIDDDRIKFITQQYVSRPEGRALTDLYLPQFALHVEIDEPQHIKNVDADRLREADVINATNHEFLRIPVNFEGDLAEFDSSIDAVIEEIQKRIRSRDFVPWDPATEMNPQTYIEKGYVDVDEDVAFRTMADAASCFGRRYTNLQKAFIPHSSEPRTYLWFPKLYENSDWLNTISEDEEMITEISKKPGQREAQVEFNISNLDRNGRRLVFARVRSPLGDLMYRFKGEYLMDIERSRQETRSVFLRVGKRVNTYAPKDRLG